MQRFVLMLAVLLAVVGCQKAVATISGPEKPSEADVKAAVQRLIEKGPYGGIPGDPNQPAVFNRLKKEAVSAEGDCGADGGTIKATTVTEITFGIYTEPLKTWPVLVTITGICAAIPPRNCAADPETRMEFCPREDKPFTVKELPLLFTKDDFGKWIGRAHPG